MTFFHYFSRKFIITIGDILKIVGCKIFSRNLIKIERFRIYFPTLRKLKFKIFLEHKDGIVFDLQGAGDFCRDIQSMDIKSPTGDFENKRLRKI